MRKGGGKAKGSSFERLICKELSLWITGGEHQDVFWRSAMSGGRSTVAMKKGDKLALPERIEKLVKSGTANAGMVAKLAACQVALKGGAKNVAIESATLVPTSGTASSSRL